jgi:hypothetical protein
MTPDFSMYYDMPLVFQMINVFRSRWCRVYWQEHGLTVIPTIGWSDGWSFEFCFDGIESGSTVAVATQGVRDCKEGFMKGFLRCARQWTQRSLSAMTSRLRRCIVL